jgi:hypothetical protein
MLTGDTVRQGDDEVNAGAFNLAADCCSRQRVIGHDPSRQNLFNSSRFNRSTPERFRAFKLLKPIGIGLHLEYLNVLSVGVVRLPLSDIEPLNC